MAEGEEGAGNGEIRRASGVGRSQQRVANGGRGRVKGDPRELGAWMDEMPLREGRQHSKVWGGRKGWGEAAEVLLWPWQQPVRGGGEGCG